MIKGEELMLGNWVYSNKFFGKVQITLLKHGVYPDCEPIPLTPEILLACGFTFTDVHVFPSYFIVYGPPQKRGMFDIADYGNGLGWVEGSVVVHLKYLHQLQNLYYSLTGKEINYTP